MLVVASSYIWMIRIIWRSEKLQGCVNLLAMLSHSSFTSGFSNEVQNSVNVRFQVFQGTYENFWKSTYYQNDEGFLPTFDALIFFHYRNMCEPTFIFYFHFFPSSYCLTMIGKKKLIQKPTFTELSHFCFHLKYPL